MSNSCLTSESTRSNLKLWRWESWQMSSQTAALNPSSSLSKIIMMGRSYSPSSPGSQQSSQKTSPLPIVNHRRPKLPTQRPTRRRKESCHQVRLALAPPPRYSSHPHQKASSSRAAGTILIVTVATKERAARGSNLLTVGTTKEVALVLQQHPLALRKSRHRVCQRIRAL